jgi:hypothetical protein|tara:strand:- start:14 stop:757 length:744 start_codon:yes stop_codon:yes gene_type:complete
MADNSASDVATNKNIETQTGPGPNRVCGGSVSLRIKNLAIKRGVEFYQIKVTGFSDTVTPSWSEEAVYGRMDPIATYQGTTRAMSLSFELGPFSDSDDRKKLAMKKIGMLMRMQYPTYSDLESALSISRPPLLEINFHNYIKEDIVCYLTDVSYAPVDGMSATTVPKFTNNEILPQRISVSLSIKVLHTTAPGWLESGEWTGSLIGPMGIDKELGVLTKTAAALKLTAKQAAEEVFEDAADTEKKQK